MNIIDEIDNGHDEDSPFFILSLSDSSSCYEVKITEKKEELLIDPSHLPKIINISFNPNQSQCCVLL